MFINATELATLLKFNSGKNARAIKAACDDPTVAPGSHPVALTFTLDGFLDRSPDGEQTRSTLPSASDALEIALSKVNAATRAVIVQAVLDVQRGAVLTPAEERKALEQQWHTDPSEDSWAALERSREVQALVESVKVTKTTPRTGATVFRGHLVIEDWTGTADENVKGLTVVNG